MTHRRRTPASTLSLAKSTEGRVLCPAVWTPVQLFLQDQFLEGTFHGQNPCTFLRLLIALDKLPSRAIVPIYTATSRDRHPGRPWVVNEGRLKGERAGGEKKRKGKEAWSERVQCSTTQLPVWPPPHPPGASHHQPRGSSKSRGSQPSSDCTRLSLKATIQWRPRTKLEQRRFDPFQLGAAFPEARAAVPEGRRKRRSPAVREAPPFS